MRARHNIILPVPYVVQSAKTFEEPLPSQDWAYRQYERRARLKEISFTSTVDPHEQLSDHCVLRSFVLDSLQVSGLGNPHYPWARLDGAKSGSKIRYRLRRLVADSIDGLCLLVACDPSRVGMNATEDWIKDTSHTSGWCRWCQSVLSFRVCIFLPVVIFARLPFMQLPEPSSWKVDKYSW